jgi:hypothetical protein
VAFDAEHRQCHLKQQDNTADDGANQEQRVQERKAESGGLREGEKTSRKTTSKLLATQIAVNGIVRG